MPNTQKYSYRTQHLRGTAQEWEQHKAIVPLDGELVIERDKTGSKSKYKIKIGDGDTAYKDLSYLSSDDEILPKKTTLTLKGGETNWLEVIEGEGTSGRSLGYYKQSIELDVDNNIAKLGSVDITPKSKIDIVLSVNEWTIFYNKSLSLMCINENGAISVLCMGDIPTQDLTLFVNVTEVVTDETVEVIYGNLVGTLNPKSDWNQEDETQADYIKNKPIINDIVRFTPQTLTEDQKAQVRSNIGAGSNGFSGNYDDLSNKPAYIAEDGESLIIGNGKDNIAGTRGFIIFKAQRETQSDGSYKYYYYLIDNSESSLYKQFQETLSANPEATNSLRIHYLDSDNNLCLEYAEDYSKTYEVTEEGNYLKVRVEKVRKTFQPVPDSGNPMDGIKDEEGNYRYIWKPTSNPNIYEIDYTDTWSYTEEDKYSYFRLSVNPALGTKWVPTSSIVIDGVNNKALGTNSIVGGKDNVANGGQSAVFGSNNYANYAGFAAGRRNKVLNKSGFATGERNINKGYGATTMGGSNEIEEGHSYSTAIGSHLKTHNSTEVALGQYNIPLDQLDKDTSGNAKDVALSVGVGWNEGTRRDAMTIYRDGTTKFLGDVYSGSTNITQTATNANTKLKELENKTVLSLGKLPEIGEVNKLYIDEQDSQWIYKVRKTPKVENIWNGVISTSKPSTLQGAGTEDDPYQITNGNELAYIVRTQGKYSKLMNDIYLNDISNPNWKDTAKEWEGTKVGKQFSFSGEFDGQNYTVYGLYYNDPNDNDSTTANGNVACALFPRLTQSNTVTIKNLGLDYVYINSNSVAGALVGNFTVAPLTVENCYFGENVYLKGLAVACIGAWGKSNVKVTNCYSLATQSLSIESSDPFSDSGMVLGNFWGDQGSVITNCYSLNTPITGRTFLVSISNCYCTVRLQNRDDDRYGIKISKEDMTGINALDNMPNLGDAFINDYTYPHLKSFAEGWYNYQEKFATVTKEGESTTGIQFTTDINETLTGTTKVELQRGAIELAAYGSISLDTHNGPISINSNQDVVLNSSYGNIDASNKRIKNVATPTEDTDAANKKYVDDTIAHAMTVTQADYVVEQGASGIWTYRKWASGKAECWGRKHITSSMSQVTNNTFYYLNTSFPETDYPFVFTAAPSEIVTYHAPSSHMGWVYSQWENTNSHSGQYCAMRWNSVTSEADVYLDYYVVGMWK